MKAWNHRKSRLLMIVAGICCLCSVGMTACGKQEVTISTKDLEAAITKEMPSLPDMSSVDSDSEDPDVLFAYICDMDYSKIDSFSFVYSSEGKADEVAVIKLKDEANADECKTYLEKSNDQRKTQFENYDADEVPKVDAAQIVSSGKYVVLIVGDEVSEGKKAFLAEMGE